MTDRLKRIFAVIPPCKTFADVGCDHGYIAKEMLDANKCESVIIADISAKCLSKAQDNLREYIQEKRATSVVSNGFDALPKVSVALIAGMGGREIMGIIKRAKELPETLVLQPMKNVLELREFLVNSGYKIELDEIFYSAKKYYNVLKVTRGKDSLSREEIEFGRTNIKERSPDFISYIKKEISKIDTILLSESLSENSKIELTKQKEKLKKYDTNQRIS